MGRDDAVRVWGLPLSPLRRVEATEAVSSLIEAGQPSYFITANLHYAMLSRDDPVLRAVNENAAFLLADGAPLVWASRWRRAPLPERVAGADLIYDLCERAAARGHRTFFLGGPPGAAEEASRRLETLYPGLIVAGVACPPFRSLSEAEHADLVETIRSARPDLLFVAFGQPKGELWISRYRQELGVPVCVQVGASLEFVAGRVARAPLWMQTIGLEWAFRIATDPARLGPRYARNAAFLLRMAIGDLRRGRRREQAMAPKPAPTPSSSPAAEAAFGTVPQSPPRPQPAPRP